ncbi:hypothetical protein EJ06DRAFT_148514 [Trichodelitschia bisporula]|uniref:Borealin N-terminal domain-containing protein n=1 Tax=Trichodelitschia bisporula TaxID=703511 RepID=A0A6G1HMW8_9PEZI|nr:hypothetical protein EJ06DRAFT_148514 [Trichodelitschia bisporula]
MPPQRTKRALHLADPTKSGMTSTGPYGVPTTPSARAAMTPTGASHMFIGRITAAQKEALIQNLDLELEERARKLRAQYELHVEGMQNRLEMRINRIPQRLRTKKMGELLNEYKVKLRPQKPLPAPPTKTAPIAGSKTTPKLVLKMGPKAASKAAPKAAAKAAPKTAAKTATKATTKTAPAAKAPPKATTLAPKEMRGKKRASAEMTGDAENKENTNEDLEMPKKRVKTKATPAAARATRAASKKTNNPIQILSPKTQNSRAAPKVTIAAASAAQELTSPRLEPIVYPSMKDLPPFQSTTPKTNRTMAMIAEDTAAIAARVAERLQQTAAASRTSRTGKPFMEKKTSAPPSGVASHQASSQPTSQAGSRANSVEPQSHQPSPTRATGPAVRVVPPSNPAPVMAPPTPVMAPPATVPLKPAAGPFAGRTRSGSNSSLVSGSSAANGTMIHHDVEALLPTAESLARLSAKILPHTDLPEAGAAKIALAKMEAAQKETAKIPVPKSPAKAPTSKALPKPPTLKPAAAKVEAPKPTTKAEPPKPVTKPAPRAPGKLVAPSKTAVAPRVPASKTATAAAAAFTAATTATAATSSKTTTTTTTSTRTTTRKPSAPKTAAARTTRGKPSGTATTAASTAKNIMSKVAGVAAAATGKRGAPAAAKRPPVPNPTATGGRTLRSRK